MHIDLGRFRGQNRCVFKASIACGQLVDTPAGIMGLGCLHIRAEDLPMDTLIIDERASGSYAALVKTVGETLASELMRDLLLFNATPYYAVDWTLAPGAQKVYFTLDPVLPNAFVATTRPEYFEGEGVEIEYSHPLWNENNSQRSVFSPEEMVLYLTASIYTYMGENQDISLAALLPNGSDLHEAAERAAKISQAIGQARSDFEKLIVQERTLAPEQQRQGVHRQNMGAHFASFAWWHGHALRNDIIKSSGPAFVVNKYDHIGTLTNDGTVKWYHPEKAYATGACQQMDLPSARNLIAQHDTLLAGKRPCFLYDCQTFAAHQCWDILKKIEMLSTAQSHPVLDEALRHAMVAMDQLCTSDSVLLPEIFSSRRTLRDDSPTPAL
jgi:hypothetical protein